MNPLHYAACLNREGSAGVSVGNAAAAFEYYKGAIDAILLGTPEGSKLLTESEDLATAVRSLAWERERYLGLLLYSEYSNSNTPDGACCYAASNHHVFQKPFLFDPSEKSDTEMKLEIRGFVAMTLFNLATIFHLPGTRAQQDCCSSPYLRVALQLYDVAFDLLLQEENGACDDNATNISLAILNNMAEAYWSMSDYAKASRTVELQKSLLDIIIMTNQQPDHFSEREMDLFVLNTHLLQAPSGAAAA